MSARESTVPTTLLRSKKICLRLENNLHFCQIKNQAEYDEKCCTELRHVIFDSPGIVDIHALVHNQPIFT